MSDLQDALDRRQQIRDELYDPQRDAFDTIVEAARLVANPNLPAMREMLNDQYRYKDKFPDAVLSDVFDAALTPPEDTP